MSIPSRPNQNDLPDSAASELHALYREGAGEEPDAMLDRRILEAARSELHADHAMNFKLPTTWWQRWAKPGSVVAVMILTISLAWNVMDEQERAARDEFSSVESSRERASRARPSELRTEPAATAPAPMKDQAAKIHIPGADNKQSSEAQSAAVAEPQPFPARQDKAASATGAVGSLAQPPTLADAPAEARVRQAVAVPAAPPPASIAPAPALAMPKANLSAQDQSPNAGADALKEKKLDTRESVRSYARPESALRKAETPIKEADATDDAATAQEWLDQIRKLRAAGRNAEATQSLERFRKRYPNLALPDDLREMESR